MKTGFRGTFVLSWSQTEIDGLEAAPVHALNVGAAWCWRGDAVQVDGRSGVLQLGRAEGAERLRQRAAKTVHRLVGPGLEVGPRYAPAPDDMPHRPTDRGFVLTDGTRRYIATLIETDQRAQPLLMFVDELPPRETDLWVVQHRLGTRPVSDRTPGKGGVICFTPGTQITTTAGRRLVENLRVGDRVLTRDNGPQPIAWIGRRHMTGARLFAMPHLRPVRIRTGALGVERPDQELLVSPEHRMLITGAVAQDLFNTPEVLVAAKDLIDRDKISVDLTVPAVTYIHLLLPAHNVLWANGVPSESFHPANSALGNLTEADRLRLMADFPDLGADPHLYGDHARRNLTAAEAAILQHAA